MPLSTQHIFVQPYFACFLWRSESPTTHVQYVQKLRLILRSRSMLPVMYRPSLCRGLPLLPMFPTLSPFVCVHLCLCVKTQAHHVSKRFHVASTRLCLGHHRRLWAHRPSRAARIPIRCIRTVQDGRRIGRKRIRPPQPGTSAPPYSLLRWAQCLIPGASSQGLGLACVGGGEVDPMRLKDTSSLSIFRGGDGLASPPSSRCRCCRHRCPGCCH